MTSSEAAAPSRILVVRLGSMGDIVHTLPAVAMLRRALPHATIGWAVEPRWAELLSSEAAVSGPRCEEKPLVDVVHTVDTLAWRAALFSNETWREFRDALRAIRDMHYDVAADFQGAWKSAVLAQLSRAPRRVGFMQPREKPATLFYTHQVAAQGRHVVEQNISLAAEVYRFEPGPATVPHQEISFPLPSDPSAERACEQQLRDLGVHSFVIINPGAGWGAKRWPAERYAEVACALAVHGLRSIVNFGPREEQLARAVERAVAPPLSPTVLGRQGGNVPLAIAMSTTVAELIALTRRARLCIGGDTGPVHLAAALGIPVVALFGPTDPARSGPYSDRAVVLRSPASRTTTSHHREPEEGLLQITAAEVIGAARHLLAQTTGARQ